MPQNMQPQSMKAEIIRELDSRIQRLKAHRFDQPAPTGNQYEQLNQALSKVISVPLTKELEDVRAFVMQL